MATVSFEGQDFIVREAYVDELEAIFARARANDAQPPPPPPAPPLDAYDGQALSDPDSHRHGRLLVRLADLLNAQGRGLCAAGQPHRRQCAALDWEAQRAALRETLGQIPQLAGMLRGAG